MIDVLLVPLTRPFVYDYLGYWSSCVSDSLSRVGLKPYVYVWPSVEKPPMKCFVWSRRQYNSPCLLSWLYSRVSRSTEFFVVGIGYLDAYSDALNFVFGEASPAMKTAIVYTRRLDPCFYGESFNPTKYVGRVATEIVHELGHLLGLPHCSSRECVMCFSNSVYDVDSKTRFFCRRCGNELKKLYV